MVKNTNYLDRGSIRVQGRLLNFSKPLLMGIYNLTPDSFYDGGQLNSVNKTLLRAEEDLNYGMDILDLGGYSTRPGADIIPIEEEWVRIRTFLQNLRKTFPKVIISVDTFRSEIASRSIQEGADIINDISGGDLDQAMYGLIAKEKVPYIVMHSRGTPQTMQKLNTYNSLVLDILDELQKKVFTLRELQVKDIIIDPGFGFAKNIEQNFELLRRLENFGIFNLPVLVGLSRKSMVYKPLHIASHESLPGTTAVHILALERGANILRVHDMAAAQQARKIWEIFSKQEF